MEVEVDSPGRVLVLVVDDEATMDAAAVRSATIGALRPTLKQLFRDGQSGLDTDWLRSDLRVVVVHPSTPGSSRATGPSEAPSLALITANASIADVDALADSAAQAIESAVAPSGVSYSLLKATAQTVELLARTRPPADASEASLLASIGEPEELVLVVATSSDDASAGSIDSYAWWAPPPPFGLVLSSILSPLARGEDACAGVLDSTSRLAAWVAEAVRAGVSFEVLGAPCETLQQYGFDSVIGDVEPWCLPATPVTRPDGTPACLVTATFLDDASCASRPGMLDPMAPDGVRRPQSSSADAGLAGRVCEVHELEGLAATACSESPTCDGCTPGWCVTQGGSRPCADGSPRFVQGAVPSGSALLQLVCGVAP